MKTLVLSIPPKPVLPCCCLRLTCGQHRELILRYGGIFLDEFSDRGPKDLECARILRYICSTDEGSCLKLMVAGYALESHHLRNILGDHHMVTVTGRKYTMQRCQIDSSGDKDSACDSFTPSTGGLDSSWRPSWKCYGVSSRLEGDVQSAERSHGS